jgi:hypothetical protein
MESIMFERSAGAQMPQTGVGRFGDQMREAAHSLLHDRKQRIATAVEGFADAFHNAAGALDPNGQYGAAHYAQRAAARIERISDGVRNYHLNDMVASAEGLARRRPALYVAGAVAVGFILSRLLSQPARAISPREPGSPRERW